MTAKKTGTKMTKPAKPVKSAGKNEPKFEDAMSELEDVVRQLEAGDVPLEESLAAFEKGVSLVRLLHTRLDSVQEKIEELTQNDHGRPETKPLVDD
jgi:exodeoxyribonuclease VII small subunit